MARPTLMKPLQRLGRYSLLLLLSVVALGPFLWLLSTALKSADENIFQYPPQFWPTHATVENFKAAWQAVPMGQYFLNSIGVSLATVTLNLVISTLAAYPLARLHFRGEKLAFFAILASMMIPFQVLMIPLYLLMMKLGLGDSHGRLSLWLGLTIPFAVSGFGIFFVRQAMVTLPRALEEAAVMDGCNSLQTLWYVLLPQIKPTLATLAVLSLLTSWGELLWPSILISDPKHFTLPVGLVQLQGFFSANWRLVAAGTVLSMAPILVAFVFLQRYFVSGTLAGAVKE